MRRALPPGASVVAALIPSAVCLLPAFLARQAPTFRDQADFFFPLKLYTADRLRSGQIPLWNPWSGAGEPWLANAQSGVFYPPTWLFLIPSPALAAGLFLLVHFAIAAGGMWRFCKEEGVTDSGALAAAAIFAGSGLAVSLSAYWNHFGAFAYLPWIAALARSGLRRTRAAAGLAGLLGLQAMAGSPEASAGSLVVAFLLILEPRPIPESGWRELGRAGRVGRFLVSAGLGLALAAWVLVPFGELALHSQRRAPLDAEQRELGAVRADALASAVGVGEIPNFFLTSVYVGPVALVAAACAFLEKERRPLVLLLSAIGLAGLLLAAAGPPGRWLRLLPGLDRVRYPAKALAATSFALAALSGLGVDSLRFVAERKRLRTVILLLAGCGLAALAVSGQATPARAAAAAGLLGLVVIGLARPGSSLGAWFASAAALSMVVSFALVGRSLFRYVPEAEIRARPESVAFLAQVPGRILTPPMSELGRWAMRDAAFDAGMVRRQREALIGYTNLLARVRTIRTAAALPTQAAEAIASSIDSEADPARAAGPASGRTYWTPFPPEGLGSRKVGEFYRAPLNPYRPRASFVREYAVEQRPERAWSLVASGQSDWSRRVLLDREPTPRPDGAGGRFVVASLAEDAPERVVAEVSADAGGILVLTDLAYPGWTASVDGRPAPLLTADGFFRAVAIPAGSHRVTFRYRPLSFYVGSGVSLVALVLLLWWSLQPEASTRRTA
ncbi:MAG TPA: YfhO family protein [Thermoanaerobaculia bacterium]|nr:YfhO family protein [Thermoanaerobaculia bacterium]